MDERKLNKISETLQFYRPVENAKGGCNGAKGLFLKLKNFAPETKEHHNKTTNVIISGSNDFYNKLKDVYQSSASQTTTRIGNKVYLFPVAFSFGGGEQNYLILNPTNNVPHLKIRFYENSSVCDLNNKTLVNDMYKIFALNPKKQFTAKIHLQFFATINGMDLYRMQTAPFEEFK